MSIEEQIQASHKNMLDAILNMFLKREPIQSDFANTKIEFAETPDKLKQFYNVSIRVGSKFELLGTVNIDGCDFSKPISPDNGFTLNFVPVMGGMEPLQNNLDI